eukprot:c1395_g1_i2 orf=56-235(+)
MGLFYCNKKSFQFITLVSHGMSFQAKHHSAPYTLLRFPLTSNNVASSPLTICFFTGILQ